MTPASAVVDDLDLARVDVEEHRFRRVCYRQVVGEIELLTMPPQISLMRDGDWVASSRPKASAEFIGTSKNCGGKEGEFQTPGFIAEVTFPRKDNEVKTKRPDYGRSHVDKAHFDKLNAARSAPTAPAKPPQRAG